MALIRQKWPGDYVRTAGIVALLCLPLPAFAAKAGGGSSTPYSYAELLLDDLRAVPGYELGPKQYLLVIGAFEKVAEKHPAHPKTDHGLLVRGELYEELTKRFKGKSYRDEAVEAYRALAEGFPDSPLRAEALSSLGGLGIEVAESPAPQPATVEGAIDHEAVEILRPVNLAPPLRQRAKNALAVLRQVRFWTQNGYTRVVIELDDATSIRYDRIHKPERLYIDFLGSRLDRKLRPTSTVDVGDGLVQRIRTGQNRRGVARVVFDLDQQAHFTTSWLSNPPRLVVELRRTPRQLLAENTPPRLPAADPLPVIAERPQPDLLGSAAHLSEVLPPPRYARVPFSGGPTAVAGKLSLDAPGSARRIADQSAAIGATKPPLRETFEPPVAPEPAAPTQEALRSDDAVPMLAEMRPPVVSEEILPPFLTQDPVPRPPVRERFEPLAIEPVAPSRPAIESVGDAPIVTASRTPQPSTDLSVRRERMVLARLEPPPPPKVLDLPAPKPAKTTSRGNRNLIRALGLKVGRIVIDPGHGGHDTGTIGAGKLREKDLVNDIAQRLGKLIREGLGSEVIFTRTDDRFVRLRQRMRVANDSKADLFISIHANSARQRSVRGIETFYLNLTTNSWAMAVAARENAAAERSVHELENLVAKITRNENISESREFAAKVQSSLYNGLSKETKGLRNRGVRKAPMIVLIGAKMPAILAEVSFLSNASDEKLLKTSKYRDKIAEALYKGVSAYADTLSSVTVTEKATTTAGMD